MMSLAQMYIQGVSTRKVKKVVEDLCGFEVSSSEVSRACKQLDEELTAWRNRPLGCMPYLYLDARYEKVRHGGHVIDCAVLVASGVDDQGCRHLLGVSVSLSEHEVHWRGFLESLNQRGLHGVKLLTSDAHSGLKAAKKAVLPSVPWQRCQFHLQQNAQSYVPAKSMKQSVANKIRSIFDAEAEPEALRLLQLAETGYEKSAPNLASWMSSNIEEGLAVFKFPQQHWKKIRTNNMLERCNREIKRRTRVVGIFPNIESCERLVTAILIDISDEWQSGNRYLTMEDDSS